MRCSVARLCERTVGRRVPPLWAGGGLLHTTAHCVVVTALGAELRRYGKPHTPLRQGRERAEHFGGGQWAEPRALRSSGVGAVNVADRSVALLHQQPQQASCRDDQHDDDAPRS